MKIFKDGYKPKIIFGIEKGTKCKHSGEIPIPFGSIVLEISANQDTQL